MHVERTHHVDASEPDEAGMYDYFYEYDIYRFTDGPTCVVARSYAHEPDEAHFLRVEIEGHSRPMTDADFLDPLVFAAQGHLRAIGKVRLSWLSDRGVGYELVPAAVAPSARTSPPGR